MIHLVQILLAQLALLGGGPVAVQCQLDPTVVAYYAAQGEEIDGLAYEAQRMMQIRPGLCAAANAFAVKPILPKGPKPGSADYVWNHSSDEAWSLYVLAHESKHIAYPSFTEAQVTCLAVLDLRGFARRLGASATTARRVLAIDSYETRMQPDEYHSACAATARPFKIRIPRAAA